MLKPSVFNDSASDSTRKLMLLILLPDGIGWAFAFAYCLFIHVIFQCTSSSYILPRTSWFMVDEFMYCVAMDLIARQAKIGHQRRATNYYSVHFLWYAKRESSWIMDYCELSVGGIKCTPPNRRTPFPQINCSRVAWIARERKST